MPCFCGNYLENSTTCINKHNILIVFQLLGEFSVGFGESVIRNLWPEIQIKFLALQLCKQQWSAFLCALSFVTILYPSYRVIKKLIFMVPCIKIYENDEKICNSVG